MSQKSRVVLKTKFEAGRTPAEKDFADMLDSGLNQIDDQVSIRKIGEGDTAANYMGIGSVDPESPISIKNRSGDANLLGFEDRDGNEKWQIEIDPDDGDEGLNIKEKGADNSNIFIKSGGDVGIGTNQPKSKLHVVGEVNIDGQLEVKDEVKAKKFEGKVSWNNLTDVPNQFVPQGSILMWSGMLIYIPYGWALCDGLHGTPDLRDRFIVGAGGNYNSGLTGGQEQVTLGLGQIPSHGHSASSTNAGSHTHNLYRGYDYKLNRWELGGGYGLSNAWRSGKVSASGNHSHAISVGNSGGNGAHENRPPYFALCYIMKL